MLLGIGEGDHLCFFVFKKGEAMKKLTRLVFTLSFLIAVISAGCAVPVNGKNQDAESSIAIYSDTLTKLAEKSFKETVLIKTGNGLGSGVVYTASGHVLTNAHVVGSVKTVRVQFSDGTVLEGRVIGAPDTETDVAVVKVEPKGTLAVAVFADSNEIKRGDMVYAIGAPRGLDYSVTAGIVSGLHRDISGSAQETIQTDAAINPGNSGGPLYNIKGEVIGLNVMIRGDSNNLGFTIPSNDVAYSADKIIKDGKVVFGRLGAELLDLADIPNEEAAKAIGLSWPLLQNSGVYIRGVQPKTPAEAGGLNAGDIVVSFAGVPVLDSFQFKRLVSRSPVGTPLSLVVVRSGKEVTLTISLMAREPEKSKFLQEEEFSDPDKGPKKDEPGKPESKKPGSPMPDEKRPPASPEKPSFPNFGKGIILLPGPAQEAVRNSQGLLRFRYRGQDGKPMANYTNAFLVDAEHIVSVASFLEDIENPADMLYEFNAKAARLVGQNREVNLALFKLEAPYPDYKKPTEFSERTSIGQEYYSLVLKNIVLGNVVPYTEKIINKMEDEMILVFPARIKRIGLGAPIFNLAGQVVGMWADIDQSPEDPTDVHDVSYAISSEIIKMFVEYEKEAANKEEGPLGTEKK